LIIFVFRFDQNALHPAVELPEVFCKERMLPHLRGARQTLRKILGSNMGETEEQWGENFFPML